MLNEAQVKEIVKASKVRVTVGKDEDGFFLDVLSLCADWLAMQTDIATLTQANVAVNALIVDVTDGTQEIVEQLEAENRAMRRALIQAHEAMRRHNEASFQCESSQGAQAAGDCTKIIQDALDATGSG